MRSMRASTSGSSERRNVFVTKRRTKQPRVRDRIVRERGFKNFVLSHEDVAEFEYQPTSTDRAYRMIALRKTIDEERGRLCMGTHTRYFFYITNVRDMTADQVVREANDRCNQERLIEQLKSGVWALHCRPSCGSPSKSSAPVGGSSIES